MRKGKEATFNSLLALVGRFMVSAASESRTDRAIGIAMSAAMPAPRKPTWNAPRLAAASVD